MNTAQLCPSLIMVMEELPWTHTEMSGNCQGISQCNVM